MMENVRPIRNDEDLSWALAEVEHYFDNVPEPGTPEGDRFDVLSDLIESYENKHHPIGEAEPIELLRTFMEATGKTQSDFAHVIGSNSRASEVLNKKRLLNLAMIRRIAECWPLPVESLIAPYHLDS